MTEQPTPMWIADPEMIDGVSMTQIILKTAAGREGWQRTAESKTNDAKAAFESVNGPAFARMMPRTYLKNASKVLGLSPWPVSALSCLPVKRKKFDIILFLRAQSAQSAEGGQT